MSRVSFGSLARHRWPPFARRLTLMKILSLLLAMALGSPSLVARPAARRRSAWLRSAVAWQRRGLHCRLQLLEPCNADTIRLGRVHVAAYQRTACRPHCTDLGDLRGAPAVTVQSKSCAARPRSPSCAGGAVWTPPRVAPQCLSPPVSDFVQSLFIKSFKPVFERQTRDCCCLL